MCKTANASKVAIEGETLQEVDELTYLGCEIRKEDDIRHKVSISIGKAGAALRNSGKVWSEDGMSLRTKLKLFNSIRIDVWV